MTDTSLYRAVLTSSKTSLSHIWFENYTPIRRLLSTIYYYPYQWRKLLLEACRVQQPVRSNRHLTKLYKDTKKGARAIQVRVQNRHRRYTWVTLTLRSVIDTFENIYDNPMLCALLSYFVRAEGAHNPTEFFDLFAIGSRKEILASQSGMREQQLDYSCLTTDDKGAGIHFEIAAFPYRTVALFKKHIKQSITHFTSPGFMLFPYYNGRKNIGYKTQTLLEADMIGPTRKEMRREQPKRYTTLSLLQWYHKSGKQIGGPLELRHSFKPNDLKPRLYYCLGGDCFWDGLYVKDIAKDLVKMFPSTHPFSRFEVKRIVIIGEDEVFITYDYTSFTTSLAELRYCLWNISTLFDKVKVWCLDVHAGPIQVDLGDLLRNYNSSINENSEFDVSRLFKDRLNWDETDIFTQTRSGSLGVQGNIVFSTLNHGISLSGLTDTPDQDSCVGDDAAFKIHMSMLVTFGIIANKLGVINDEKVTKIRPPTLEDTKAFQRDSYKYLKRPIGLQYGGQLITGFLDFFPNLSPVIFPAGDGIHSTANEDLDLVIKTFVMQWGRFLNTMANTPYSTDQVDEDIEFILIIIRSVYLKAHLPFEGCIPGSGFQYRNVSAYYKEGDPDVMYNVNFYVPPCDNLSVFRTDWLELLLARYAGREFTTPVWVTASIPMPEWTYPGDECFVTSTPLAKLLEGLSYISAKQVLKTATFDEKFVDEFGEFIRGKDKGLYLELIEVTIEGLPGWYRSAYEVLYPRPSGITRYHEATLEAHTLFGSDE
jgi:hypothetical protein